MRTVRFKDVPKFLRKLAREQRKAYVESSVDRNWNEGYASACEDAARIVEDAIREEQQQ